MDRDTARTIAAAQRPDGAIPWESGRHVDTWNHTEAAMGLAVAGFHDEAEAAYTWLARTQNPDGSWYASYEDCPVDTTYDANFIAYTAVGIHHHWLLTRSHTFLTRMWPTVRTAIDFVLTLQRPTGEFPWRTNEDRTTSNEVMLTGCASIHHALLCAAALADDLATPRPDWLTAAKRLRTTITERPETFTAKPHAMDWYYPVLGGVLDPTAAESRLNSSWNDFVVPGLGVKCVQDQPWVTGGETAELALLLASRGECEQASRLITDIARLRNDDGSYWTGYQYANKVLWPAERTTWTAGAVLLALAAIDGEPATCHTFNRKALP